MAVTQKDVAQLAGVSRQAVAHTLNGRGRISASTRERILAAVVELGYRPNPVARALSTGRTNLLAFWFNSKLVPHTVEVANQIGRLAWTSPYNLMLADVTRYLQQWERDPHEFAPAQWPVDGIFAFELGALPDWMLNQQGQRTTPVVYLGYDYPGSAPSERVDAVVVNFSRAAEEAVRHLLQTRKRVAMLCLEPLAQHGDGRTVAYKKLVLDAGRKPEFIHPPFELPIRELARVTLTNYIKANGCPDALFCGNDEQAIAAHLALSDLGYRVPEDVALVGCDGLDEAEYHVPPLSTIVQPFAEMGTIAWDYLQKRLANPDTPRQFTRLEARFVARKSSE